MSKHTSPRVAVLFDGAGLARLGLEMAGLDCVGFESDPILCALSQRVGSGRCIQVPDVTKVPLDSFDAVWISVPGVGRSSARTQHTKGATRSNSTAADRLHLLTPSKATTLAGVDGKETSTDLSADLLADQSVEDDAEAVEALIRWALSLKHPATRWVSCVSVQRAVGNEWGTLYNASQFLQPPRQNRNLVIGGDFPPPHILRPYMKHRPGVCPCITATEYKGSARDARRASRFYGRRLTLDECAFHQGFSIPSPWHAAPTGWTPGAWRHQLYRAIGNSIPVFMAHAFGASYASASLLLPPPSEPQQPLHRMRIDYLIHPDAEHEQSDDNVQSPPQTLVSSPLSLAVSCD